MDQAAVLAVVIKYQVETVRVILPLRGGQGAGIHPRKVFCQFPEDGLLVRAAGGVVHSQAVKVAHELVDFPYVSLVQADNGHAYIGIIGGKLLFCQAGQGFPDRGGTHMEAFLEYLKGKLGAAGNGLGYDIIS